MSSHTLKFRREDIRYAPKASDAIFVHNRRDIATLYFTAIFRWIINNHQDVATEPDAKKTEKRPEQFSFLDKKNIQRGAHIA
jgi:hypothetical protein